MTGQRLKAKPLRSYLPQSFSSALNSSRAGHHRRQDTGLKAWLPQAVQLPWRADSPFLQAWRSHIPPCHGSHPAVGSGSCRPLQTPGRRAGRTFQQQHKLRSNTDIRSCVFTKPRPRPTRQFPWSGTPLAAVSFPSSPSPPRWPLTNSSSAMFLSPQPSGDWVCLCQLGALPAALVSCTYW